MDSSSGALGSAVNKTLDQLLPAIINAPTDPNTRQKWLEHLWQAMEDDGVDYLAPVGDRWGEVCGSVETANKWAEELMPTLRSCWTVPNPGNYFHGATACLSCLLVAGRYQDLFDLLALDRKPFWHYRRFGVEAMLAMGKKSEALKYAEASRGLNQPDSAIDQVCEEILISSGLQDAAYRRYGLSAAQGYSYHWTPKPRPLTWHEPRFQKELTRSYASVLQHDLLPCDVLHQDHRQNADDADGHTFLPVVSTGKYR